MLNAKQTAVSSNTLLLPNDPHSGFFITDEYAIPLMEWAIEEYKHIRSYWQTFVEASFSQKSDTITVME